MIISSQIPGQVAKLFLWFYFTISFLYADAHSSDSKGEVNNFCARSEEILLNVGSNPVELQWVIENIWVKEGWNVQFGNPIARTLLAKLIVGIGNTNLYQRPHYISRVCPKLNVQNITENLITGFYSGSGTFGSKQAPVSCSTRSSLGCNITSSDKLAVLTTPFYVVHIDGRGKGEHNFGVVITCLQNGEVMWFVATVSKTISEKETASSIEYLKSVGVNTDIIVPMQSSACQLKGSGGHGWNNRRKWGQRRQWG